MAGEPLIEARGLVKRFGEFTAVDAIDVEVHAGEAFGFLGPNGAGKSSTMRMIGCTSPVSAGTLRVFGLDAATQRQADQGPARRRPPVRPARQRPDRRREPDHLRPLLRHPAGGVQAPHGRAARVRPAHRAGDEQGRTAVGRHEAAGDDRPLADQRARPAAARRADDRPRPAGAPRALGPPVPAQAAGRHARADHPLHGRGRAALRPPRRDGQGAHRRRGLAAAADRGALHARGARAALRRRHQRGRGPACRRRRRAHRGAARSRPDLRRRRREGAGDGPRARRHAGERARPPQQPGGRLPPPHRPDLVD